MRISYVYDIDAPGRQAAPIQILQTCRAIRALGVPVTVYGGTSGPRDSDRLMAYYGVSPIEGFSVLPIGGRRLTRVLGEADGDRHCVVTRGEPGLALADRLRKAGPVPNRLLIYEAHRLCHTEVGRRRTGRLQERLPGASGRLKTSERRAVEGADALVCLSEGVREALATEFRVACPTLILPSGTTVPPDGRPPEATGDRDIDVLYAGKIEPRKGVDVLVEAMAELPGRRLWIVGGGAEEVTWLARLAEGLGVADRVVLTGHVEPPRVAGFLARARVGVCPLPIGLSAISERFTSPLKILELMAAGVPVVASDLPSTRELLEPDRTALLVEPGNPRALAHGIRRVLEDRSLADRLGRAASERVVEYSWQNRARKLVEFLGSLA